MKKYIFILSTIILPLLFSSCLKDDLDDVEYSADCDISSVAFEHRWAVPSDVEGIWTLKFKEMSVTSDINKDNNTVTVDLTVPATDNSFTEEERNKASLSSLACSFFVSNAAQVTPLDGAPRLGTLGDYSAKTYKYRVTSASGVYKDWQININSFTK